MALTSGFYNSINGDRRYNAEQMSTLFDGIINDGVFANIGTAFGVRVNSGNTLNIGIGRAWFKSTWVNNDALYPITLDETELVLNRIDTVVIEVDRTTEVRAASFKVVKGTPATSPTKPELLNTEHIRQVPLCDVYREAGAKTISQANITNRIGTSDCPYITGILQVQNIDNIVAQWQAQWVDWFAHETATTEDEANDIIAEWNQWYTQNTTTNETQMEQWLAQQQADFNEWILTLKDIIDDDTAASLANHIAELQSQFETLATDQAIYVDLEDAQGNPIEGSDGTVIITKRVFGVEDNPGTNTEVPIDNSRLISTYVHTKAGTVHNFSGRGENGRAYITEPFNSGDTISVNGVTVPGYCGADAVDSDTIVQGRWVTFIFDGNSVNFRGGGGLTANKLAAADAQANDVVAPKKFYSQNKVIKTGTLSDKSAQTSPVSVGSDGSYLYARIPVGAYRNLAGTGYPEIKIANNDAITNLPGGNRGAWQQNYSGSNVTIPQGYHNGSGHVGVAGGNRGAWTGTYSGSNVGIPQGYHNGSGYVTVAGGNKGSWGSTINPGGSVTIPQGYHSGGGKVTANKTQPNVFAVGRISYVSYADPPASGTTFNGNYIRVEVVPSTYAEAFCQVEGWYCVWYGGLPGNPFFLHCNVGYSFGTRDTASSNGGDILIARVEW